MLKTELSNRKKAVLAAIVKAYIETGEPIGSKILMGLLENAPSSATLRNEMNELCSLGYLTQPHTSAGRVPTSSAYKFYIDSLMQQLELSDTQKHYIDRFFISNGITYEAMPQAAADLVNELTGFPAFSCFSADENLSFKQIRLINTGRTTAALLTVTSDGRTLSSMCRLNSMPSADSIERFEKLVKERLLRKPLSHFSKANLQNLVMSLSCDDFVLMPLLTELFKMAEISSAPKTFLSGTSKLYNFTSAEDARKIASLMSNPELFLAALKKENQNNVIFGSDTAFLELSNKSIVLTDYECKGQKCGKIGIIAPSRMSYDKIIPSIKYVAESLTTLMTETVKDMED